MKLVNKNRKKSAFSLIELSIVILIIGIIIVGVTKATVLFSYYKLSTARTQTESSPVNGISDLAVWYEATLEDSFIEKETDDYEQLSAAEITLGKGKISTWYDISNTAGNKDNLTQSTADSKPRYYADCINGLPCVYFDGTDDILSFAGTSIDGIVGSNYTIFIVSKKTDTGDVPKVMLGSSSSETLHIGFLDNDQVSWGHASGSYAHADPSISLENNNPALHVFSNEILNAFDGTANNNYFYYTNGSTTAETLTQVSNGVSNSSTTGLSAYANQTVGGGLNGGTTYYFQGGIGEIIVFTRALKSQERDAVEDYLIKKWFIKPDNS